MSNFCTNQTFPFTYFDVNGDVVAGTAGDDGICTFPNANCGPDTLVHDCCEMDSDINPNPNPNNILLICLACMYIPLIWVERFGGQKEDKEKDKEKMTPPWVENLPPLAKKIFYLGLLAIIMAFVYVPILMANSIQSNLNVNHRNALLGANAFMDPYRDIFQFIEDVVLIRVSYSLATGHKKLTNKLMHVGIVGAFLTGLAAAVIGTILGVIPAALSTLTNPGAANDEATYPDCALIGSYDNSIIKPYWIIQMWGIPGQLLGLVISGFIFGAHQWLAGGWIMGISMCVVVIIWFGGGQSGLTLLGIAEAVTSWFFPLFMISYIMCPLLLEEEEEDQVAVTPTPEDNLEEPLIDENTSLVVTTVEQPQHELPSNKSLIIDALKIMTIDLITQLCISIGVYIALRTNTSVGYQITALQAALPSVGVAYSFSIGFLFKLKAPRYIVKRDYKMFIKYTWLTLLGAFCMIPVIIGSIEPDKFKTWWAFNYGENACEYASTEQCVDFFTQVFGKNGSGGQWTLPYTFNAMSFASSVDVIAFVTRSILLTLNDFDFALKATLIAAILYIPAIIVATVGNQEFVNQSITLFIVMYLPQFIIAVLFLGRIVQILNKMKRGESGSWEIENMNKREETGFSLSKSYKLA